MAQYPEHVRQIEMAGASLAHSLRIPHAVAAHMDGLYVRAHRKRDPINRNKWRTAVKVRVKKHGATVFEEVVERNTFPTDHLITQLALIT
jgi:hypothetical protein